MFCSVIATSWGSPISGKRGVGALVPFQGLFKAVLAVENVAHVGVQARQPEVVAVLEEDVAGPFARTANASSYRPR